MQAYKRVLLRVLLFALLGLVFEVLFTDLGAMLQGKIGPHGNTFIVVTGVFVTILSGVCG